MPHSLRLPPPVFGAGLIEAVPDEAILARADPEDLDGDGISGRAHLVHPPAWVPAGEQGAGPGPVVGRFSRKAQVAGLFQQVVEAYHQDMGITSEFLPVENVNPQALAASRAADRVPDPEVSSAEVHAVVDYVRMLAPPRPGPETAEVARGRALFAEVGCAGCHTPVLRTGDYRIRALAFRDLEIYSNLILHDLGEEALRRTARRRRRPARVADPTALGAARYARLPLDGEAYLMHDGRARSVHQAVVLHGGEAARARAAYEWLAPVDRAALLAFVESR